MPKLSSMDQEAKQYFDSLPPVLQEQLMQSTAALNKYKAAAPEKNSLDSKYEITLTLLHE